jgi:amidase
MALVRSAAEHLADAGYAVEEVEIPDIGETWKLWQRLISTEIAILQREQMVQMGSPAFAQALDGLLHMGPALDGESYMRAVADRSRLVREWLAFLEERPLILSPASVKPTPKVNADLDGDAAVKAIFWNDLRFLGAINVVSLPAVVVPVGLVDGHPVGVQIVGSRYREDLCLEAAAAIEARAGTLVQQLWVREG